MLRLPSFQQTPVRRALQTCALALFLLSLFYVCWPYGSPEYDKTLARKEWVPAEFFLWLDPLLAFSAALAGKAWIVALLWAGGLLVVSFFVPRLFCGYLCPLGTLIDLFDSLLAWLAPRKFAAARGWWVHLKYYLLAAVLAAALSGVLLSGFVAAIPVVTRGLQFIFGPLELGVLKGWYLIPPLSAAYFISIALFLLVFALSLLQPRFWCRYVCPTGAVFSVFNLLRLRQRTVNADCISCQKCLKACPFDAIKADFHTRDLDCAFCEPCEAVCPTDAIQYTWRWQPPAKLAPRAPDLQEPPHSRRAFLGSALAGVAASTLVPSALGRATKLPVRPPGSVPEPQFLELCIRCGACYQVCPNTVLQPAGLAFGWDSLWTPHVVASWSGCEPKCNNCGQVCPTGAIRPLLLEEKRLLRIALAVVDKSTCLPYAGKEACQLCVDECNAAGYHALEFIRVGTETDQYGAPIEGTGLLAPVVRPDQCVGCGLCETRCHKINAQTRHVLAATAIHIEAGPGKEDRLPHGARNPLRDVEKPANPPAPKGAADNTYLPDFLK